MDFKDILLEYLQLNDLKQTDFAALIGVKQSQISEWLKGKAKPGYDIMKQILLKTGKDAEYWFGIK